MSGHSKWHNIRLRKGKQDAVRGKLFTKMAREIIVAAREGGGNPDTNLALKLAVQKAREVSMPQDNIKRAIQRGTGETGEATNFEEIIYEGYGPAGVAVMVSCLTDNRNRTVAELRNIFTKTGGNLGESGCVSWLFEKKGLVQISSDVAEEDAVILATLDAGAEDVQVDDDSYEVITAPESFEDVKNAIQEAEIEMAMSEISMIPQTNVKVDGKEAHQVLRLMEALEEYDDTQKVYSNFDIPDEIMEQEAQAA